jgi:hypothetical protein
MIQLLAYEAIYQSRSVDCGKYDPRDISLSPSLRSAGAGSSNSLGLRVARHRNRVSQTASSLVERQ